MLTLMTDGFQNSTFCFMAVTDTVFRIGAFLSGCEICVPYGRVRDHVGVQAKGQWPMVVVGWFKW